MTDKPYIGDIGVRIRTYLFTGITGYSTLEYRYKKPDTTTGTWDCSMESTVSGIIYYDTVSGDFDTTGTWTIQSYVQFDNGNRYLSQTKQFIVYDVFQ